MPRYVALLRGINLGRRRIKMDHLQAIVAELPVTAVSTFIASGNVLFTSPGRDAAKLETTLSAHLEQRLGYAVEVFVRTREEIARVATDAPLGDRWTAVPDVSTQVIFLAEPPTEAATRVLTSLETASDAFAVSGRELYWRCAGRMTDSTVWQTPPLKGLKLPSNTMRNLKTVQRLAELYPA